MLRKIPQQPVSYHDDNEDTCAPISVRGG